MIAGGGGGDCYCCLLFAGGRPSSLPGEENLELPDKHRRELDYENFFICTSITVTSLTDNAANPCHISMCKFCLALKRLTARQGRTLISPRGSYTHCLAAHRGSSKMIPSLSSCFLNPPS